MKIRIFITILALAAFWAASCKPMEEPQKGEPMPEKPVEPVLPDMDPDDEIGWYDAPYIRYEAEASEATGQCEWLSQSDHKQRVQNEASHQMAANLNAKGDYVEWVCREAAEGMVIRFSIPDAPQGGGTKGNIALYVEDEHVCDIELDSYYAWQWKKPGAGPFNWYYDNTADLTYTEKFSRMAFDEKRVLLEEKIGYGKKFRLVKMDDNAVPYTIDFVELEPVPEPLTYFDVMDGSTVCFDPVRDADLGLEGFIKVNAGLSIFIPAGHYDCSWAIQIENDNTKLLGAGPWHTEIHFSADPDAVDENGNRTINRRGVRGHNSPKNCAVKNLYLNTNLERRYLNYHGDHGLNGEPPGKGFDGSFGDGFVADNVWIEHFECGAWMSVGADAKFSRLRIRSNYADGFNLEQGKNMEFSHCNSRNNGDDQICIHYSGAETEADINSSIHHCTVELGWRAGGICVPGGGYNLDFHNILIEDQFESGMRFLSEFPTEYKVYRNLSLSRIKVINCGCKGDGNALEYGTFTGGVSSGIEFSNAGTVNIENISFEDIEIINPRSNGISIGNSGGSVLRNISMKNILIRNWLPSFNDQKYYGVNFSSGAVGEIQYSNVVFEGDEESRMSPIPENMKWTNMEQASEN